MAHQTADYSLYLVTDSTAAILGSRDLIQVVEAALKGGVTIVQYRDKHSDTAGLVSTARKLHAVTRRFNVPLLVNDRVDVALAVGCEGVHIGQDDMDLESARKLLGNSAIIGVTVSSVEEAEKACKGGADYLGIGTMFATSTKKDTKSVIGTAGTKLILQHLAEIAKDVKTVCIGGINKTNIQRVLFQSSDNRKELDGVAIVSAIMAAEDPTKAAQDLKALINTPPLSIQCKDESQRLTDVPSMLSLVRKIIKAVGEKTPLSHNMTNLVVQNFAANVALAVGASPIMANYGEEAADLAKLGGSLVINMGTVTPDGIHNYGLALRAYNTEGGPVVFDPVGAGATAVRRSAVKTLMAKGYFDLIKGNEGEIKTVFGIESRQRGVDSGTSTLDLEGKGRLVRDLALRERNIIVMTGIVDLVSDGERTFAIENGHEYLGKITGSGCVLGTIFSAMLAVHKEDKLAAAVAGLLLYTIAAEHAAARGDVRGPGTFVPALIDELSVIQRRTVGNDTAWLQEAHIKLL